MGESFMPQPESRWNSANTKAIAYGALNIISASGIVFANKAVFVQGFKFTYALTLVHTMCTVVGMSLFSHFGVFERKYIEQRKLAQLAASYVGYIVLCNLSLNINTVGFYQVMKIAVAPTVIVVDLLFFGKLPKPKIIMSVLVVCIGIAVATVTDTQMIRNLTGIAVGVCATIITALYQTWAGSKQKELRVSSMQLLDAYTPQATIMLAILVPCAEPMGWDATQRGPDTLLGFQFTWHSIIAIVISALLGLLVSLSTFLVIGATSSLTYNVVGHLKTLIILTGGCFFFGDSMPPNKLLGVGIAMSGIIWYTHLKMIAPITPPSPVGDDVEKKADANAVVNPSPLPVSSSPAPFLLPNATAKSVFTAGFSGVSARKRDQ